MENYVLYLRKSRADIELEAKGELETLARHEKLLLELAKKLKLNITCIYKEIVSGETIQARPVVQKLLNEVEQGMWTGVLVMEIERLARGDTIDQGIMARAFKISNTKIITPVKTYDPNNEFDEEYFEFSLFMSRREYKTINRRIQRGRIASAKDGKFISSIPPYGYDKVKIENDKGYTLKPNNEAEIVRLIYQMYSEGKGMTVIAQHLDDIHIKPRYRDTWSKSTIKDILNNPVYIGKIRWSYKKEIKTINDGIVKKQRTKSDSCILVDGLHDPIIDIDLYEKVQRLISIKRKQPVKKNLTLQNPLSGIVYCKKCGALMTRLAPNSRNKYDTLKCPNRYCDNISAPISLVEYKLLKILEELLNKYKLDIDEQESTIPIESTIKLKQSTLNTLIVDLNKVIAQISNTYDLVEQGIYSTEVFLERNKTLSKTKEDIENKINDIKKSISDDQELLASKSKIIPTVEKVLDVYHTLSSAQKKNLLLREIIMKVDYEKLTPNTRGNLNNDNFKLILYPKLSDV